METKPKSDNKIYEALMVERETRQKFKKLKPKDKTNTDFIEEILLHHYKK